MTKIRFVEHRSCAVHSPCDRKNRSNPGDKTCTAHRLLHDAPTRPAPTPRPRSHLHKARLQRSGRPGVTASHCLQGKLREKTPRSCSPGSPGACCPLFAAHVHHGLPGPGQRGLCQGGLPGRYRHQRCGLRLWRGLVLRGLCAAGGAQQPDHAPGGCTHVDVPDHGHLGPGVGGRDVRPRPDHVLRDALLLGVAEAGFFPRRHPVPDLLVPGSAPRAGHGHFLLRRAAPGLHLRQPAIGPAAGAGRHRGWHGWQWLFAVEGLVAVAVGIWAYFHLDNRPAEHLAQPRGQGAAAGHPRQRRARQGRPTATACWPRYASRACSTWR